MDRYEIMVGSDPEVFLVNKEGLFRSAHDVLPGTKVEPHQVQDGAVQVDGVAFEYNIKPAKTPLEYVLTHKKVMQQGLELIRSVNPDLSIKISPTATFEREYFDSLPDKVRELGCTPDFNAYTDDENPSPHTDEPFRTGAGHQHIGWTSGADTSSFEHWDLCTSLVRQLDACIYPTSLLWDPDEKRRSLYGKIGAFRPKSFGVEWRPMSNMFLSSGILQGFMFKACHKAASLLLNDGVEVYDADRAQDIIRSIRRGDNPSHDAIRDYNRWLTKEFDFPLYLPMYM